MMRVVVVAVCLTCTEQRDTSIGDAVKREIRQGLVEGHGVDKGIAISDTCKFFDFETCEEINLYSNEVRCMCVMYDACRVYHRALVVDLHNPPPSPCMSLTLHAAAGEGRRHAAAVREPGPIQSPEED